MLYGGGYKVIALPSVGKCHTLDGVVVGFAAAAGEDNFIWAAIQ